MKEECKFYKGKAESGMKSISIYCLMKSMNYMSTYKNRITKDVKDEGVMVGEIGRSNVMRDIRMIILRYNRRWKR
jgi:hypothetical protein